MRQIKITPSPTDRTGVSIEKYFADINREEMITPEEEAELSIRIKQGDKAALDKLVRANLRFVVSVAKQYQNRGLSLPDLINEGNVGLIKSAEKFDHTKGFKFISYAVWWIRQCIVKAIQENSRIIRYPVNKAKDINRMYDAMSILEQRLGRSPSTEELADILEIKSDELSNTMALSLKSVSLDSPVNSNDNNEQTILDTVSSDCANTDERLIRDSLKMDIVRAMDTLKDTEKIVINNYYGLNVPIPLSIVEISQKMNLSPERIRQIKDKAIRKLRCSYRSKILKEYLV